MNLFGLFKKNPMRSRNDVGLLIKWNPLNKSMQSTFPYYSQKVGNKRKIMEMDFNTLGENRFVFVQSVDFTTRTVTDYSFAVKKGINIKAPLYETLIKSTFTIVDPQKKSTEDMDIWLEFFRFNMTNENIVKYDFNDDDDCFYYYKK